MYEVAKKKQFLETRGTGFRRDRGGNPVKNTWRQYCDSAAMCCIHVEQGFGDGAVDRVAVDFTTLRVPNMEPAKNIALDLVAKYNVEPCVDDEDDDLMITEEGETEGEEEVQRLVTVKGTKTDGRGPLYQSPIWAIREDRLVFQTPDRAEAKKVAKELAKAMTLKALIG